MKSMKVRASVVALGITIAVIGVGVGSAIAVSGGDDQVVHGDPIAIREPVANGEPVENPERVYVGYGDETVGWIPSADLDVIRWGDDGRPIHHEGQIGWSVYNDDEVLVGYATERQGFIPLSEVEIYKANPKAYPSLDDYSRTLSDDELPPGFPTSRERTGSN